jgi:hypothetical protein
MLNEVLAASPVTQSREAVRQLIAYHNHGQEPYEMPAFYRLSGEMVLVLNNKKDAYYYASSEKRPGRDNNPCRRTGPMSSGP